ncbi:MAG: hypothetical protein ACXWC9_05075 [Pseudobdellovibrionaceae bacterium]
MKTMMKTALAVMTIAALSACGGGGGGGNTSTGGTYFTHAQLASEFVRRVNIDVAGYNVTLAKTDTLQHNYIVVYDQDYKSYDAYWLGTYNPGENMANYLNKNQNMFYYDLIPEGVNNYRDYVTGRVFEVDSSSSMNLDQVVALKQELAINKAATNLRNSYGMSEEKALDAARFAYQIQTAPKGSISNKTYDAFAKSLTGHTITSMQKAAKAGDMKSLQSMMEDSAANLGMDSQGMSQLMTGK